MTDHDAKQLAAFFCVWWAALVLEPSKNRAVRKHLADLGFIKPRGPLALTKAGKRVISVQGMGKS